MKYLSSINQSGGFVIDKKKSDEGACNVFGKGDMCVGITAIPGKHISCEIKAPPGVFLSEFVAELGADVTPQQFRHAPKKCKNYVGIMDAADSNLALHALPKMVCIFVSFRCRGLQSFLQKTTPKRYKTMHFVFVLFLLDTKIRN